MPMRLGEMVLIIRTQDYASRNLNRLSQNLGKLSKTQQLQRRLQMQGIQADRIAGRRDTLARDIGLLRQRLSIESSLLSVAQQRAGAHARLRDLESRTTAKGQLRGPGTMGFLGPAAPHVAQAQSALAGLRKEEIALEKTHADLMQQMRLTSPTLAKMNTSRASAQLGNLNKQLALTGRQLRIVQSDLAITQQAINRLRWDNIHRGGQAASRFGRVLQLTGLIAVGSFAAMGNAAANFSASATLAATQARNLGNGVDYQSEVLAKSERIQQAVIEQMRKYPGTAEDMTNATYQIFSSLDLMNNKGIVNVTKGLRILEIANKAAVAGGVSLDESMKGLIITLNNFDPDLNDVTGTLDTMFDIVRFGNIRFSDLTNIMSKVAPAAKAVGLSLEDVSGAVAQATRTLPAGTVAAGFSQLLSLFANRDFQEGIRVISKARLGTVIDITEAGKLKAPLEILRDLLKIFPELAKGGLETRRFFKLVTRAGEFSLTGRETAGREFTIQQRRVFEALVQNFASVEELQAAILANNGELEKSFQVMMKDPGVRWKVFLSQMQALALEIGTLALPALLSLVSGVQRLVTWFHNMDPATKTLITRIGVFGSALLLAGGIIASLLGSIISLVGSLGLIGRNMSPLLMLARSLAFMAGIGAIAIILKTAWTGSATAYDFLMGAMLGATAGSMFGPAGAVIGGITVPVVLAFMDENRRTPKEQAFDEFEKMQKGLPGWFARHRLSIPGTGLEIPVPLRPEFNKESFDKQWRVLVAQAKGNLPPNVPIAISPAVLQLFNKYKNQIVGLKKPTESWADSLKKTLTLAGDKTGLQLFNKFMKSVPQLENMFHGVGRSASEMAQAVDQAAQQARDSIDQAAQRMTQIFEQFRDQNASAFGELFSGPFFQSETWSLAEEWDVKPSMREINKDLKQQIGAFKNWRSTLAAIGKKKGATPELMKELTALGPNAMKFLEVLRKGSPGAWNQFIGLWRTKQAVIEKATKIDFQKQLDQWFKYGKGIAQQIILGLRSENVALDNAFKKYITQKFPNIVAEAEAAAKAEYNRTHPTAPKTGDDKKGAPTTNNSNNQTHSNNQVTVIVHPHPGETTKHALKRGAWEYANGGGHRGRANPPKGAKIQVDRPGGGGPHHAGSRG